jgi:hypothetical protein
MEPELKEVQVKWGLALPLNFIGVLQRIIRVVLGGEVLPRAFKVSLLKVMPC